LLSADQKRNEFTEVSRKDWVELLISMDEFEKSFKKNEFVSFLLIFIIKSFSGKCLLGGLC
jgi:hypothetical protein